MGTRGDVLRLTKVVINMDGVEERVKEEYIVRTRREFVGCFPTKEREEPKDGDGSRLAKQGIRYNFNFDDPEFEIVFTFMRVKEIEDQPIPGKNDSKFWSVTQTVMLRFFSALDEDAIHKLCGDEGLSNTPLLHKSLVQTFVQHRETIEKEAEEALDGKKKMLVERANGTVDPNQARDMQRYRTKFHGEDGKPPEGKPTVQDIHQAKRTNQSNLVEYEELMHTFVKFLDEDVKNSFGWSKRMTDQVVEAKEWARKSLADLRVKKDNFWMMEEGKMTKEAERLQLAAQKAEHEAVAQQEKAQLDSEEARRRMEEAEHMANEAYEAKETAERAEEAARMREQEAKKQEQVAKKAQQSALAAMQQAREEKDQLCEEKEQLALTMQKVKEHAQAQEAASGANMGWLWGLVGGGSKEAPLSSPY
eukprot:NODE_532_length_1495_cov_355.886806.p1 GENE.NODE_532_length_1495_cov_355.886806~~NODE_532_length_1495_cov_355.886806.p1  ORF type:complete len:419 (+),score=121.67 NODE_532_length_1495_cov_355.886806:3-1259(+)